MVEDSSVNTSYFANFTGNVSSPSTSLDLYSDFSIVDSRTSNHVTGNLSLFTEMRLVRGKSIVHLADGTIKTISHIDTEITC